jgi:hypothetical protein
MNTNEKHLEFIQNAITRMNHNSFLIKGWSVTLISALFALAAKDANPAFAILAYFPCLVFWGLDGFFLHQEKLFRALYDGARSNEGVELFSMDTSSFHGKVDTWCEVVFSKTLLPFHGVVLGVCILVMTVLLVNS